MNTIERKKEPPLVEVKELVVHYETEYGVVEAVNNISFHLNRGETLGLIGETGAGKTTIALALMRLLPVPPSRVVQGLIRLDGDDLMGKSEKEMRKIRGYKLSMIFQDPMTALNPVHCVGDQIAEVISLHQHVTNKDATVKAMEMLRTVGIPEERYRDYPHQFSGGMKQRVVIAMALACRPELIIADEPTTALDVTIQAQVLELMKDLRREFNTSMLLITHDFGVVAEVCNRCAVVYAGEIVESGSVEHIFNNPMHPYTRGLFDSLPSMNEDEDVEHLKSIPGLMIDPMNLPTYCSFYERCGHRCPNCGETDPPLQEVEPDHFVKCLCCTERGGKD